MHSHPAPPSTVHAPLTSPPTEPTHRPAQIADILAGVYDARNLQQVVTVVTAGTEQVLQLTTRVAVAASLAVMPAGGLRAIFFEERVASSGSRLDCSAQGTAATRSVTSFSDTAPGALGGPGMYGSASAPGAGAGGNALRGRLLRCGWVGRWCAEGRGHGGQNGRALLLGLEGDGGGGWGASGVLPPAVSRHRDVLLFRAPGRAASMCFDLTSQVQHAL